MIEAKKQNITIKGYILPKWLSPEAEGVSVIHLKIV